MFRTKRKIDTGVIQMYTKMSALLLIRVCVFRFVGQVFSIIEQKHVITQRVASQYSSHCLVNIEMLL